MTIKPEVLAAVNALDCIWRVDPSPWLVVRAELLAMDAELTELRTHHAEIAEALKDAEIGRAYLRWYASAKGYRNVIADSAHEAITMDVLHNSAREVGE